MSRKFAIKFRGMIGPDHNDEKEIWVLNRIITWTQEGIEVEADQRHAELFVRTLGLGEA